MRAKDLKIGMEVAFRSSNSFRSIAPRKGVIKAIYPKDGGHPRARVDITWEAKSVLDRAIVGEKRLGNARYVDAGLVCGPWSEYQAKFGERDRKITAARDARNLEIKLERDRAVIRRVQKMMDEGRIRACATGGTRWRSLELMETKDFAAEG